MRNARLQKTMEKLSERTSQKLAEVENIGEDLERVFFNVFGGGIHTE